MLIFVMSTCSYDFTTLDILKINFVLSSHDRRLLLVHPLQTEILQAGTNASRWLQGSYEIDVSLPTMLRDRRPGTLQPSPRCCKHPPPVLQGTTPVVVSFSLFVASLLLHHCIRDFCCRSNQTILQTYNNFALIIFGICSELLLQYYIYIF